MAIKIINTNTQVEWELDNDELKLLVTGLTIRKNYIETNSIHFSAVDLSNMDDETRSRYRRDGIDIMALNPRWMRLVLKHVELIEFLLK